MMMQGNEKGLFGVITQKSMYRKKKLTWFFGCISFFSQAKGATEADIATLKTRSLEIDDLGNLSLIIERDNLFIKPIKIITF